MGEGVSHPGPSGEYKQIPHHGHEEGQSGTHPHPDPQSRLDRRPTSPGPPLTGLAVRPARALNSSPLSLSPVGTPRIQPSQVHLPWQGANPQPRLLGRGATGDSVTTAWRPGHKQTRWRRGQRGHLIALSGTRTRILSTDATMPHQYAGRRPLSGGAPFRQLLHIHELTHEPRLHAGSPVRSYNRHISPA